MRIIDLFAGIGGIRSGFNRVFKESEFVFSSEIDKFAQKSYEDNYGEKPHGDITKIDEKDIPEFDILLGGFPCFTAGHKILTIDGYKNIEDVKVNDKVLTHENRFEKVLNTMNQDVNHLFKIKFYGSKKITTTPNHPFYVLERTIKWKNKKRYFEFSDPKWIDTKDLLSTKNKNKVHFVGINVNQEEKNINFTLNDIKIINNEEHKSSNFKYKELPFENNDFYWFLGRFLADGWYQNDKRSNRKHSKVNKVFLCCGFHEEKDVENKLKSLGMNYTKVKERTTYKFIFSNFLLMEFVKKFGKYAHGKFIPQEILDLPITYLEHFISGYFSGDGYYDKKTKTYKVTTVSENLAHGIQSIIHKVYKKPARISFVKTKDTHTIEGRVVNQRDQFHVQFTKEDKIQQAFYMNEKMWFPLKSKEEIKYEFNKVYNIEVEKDNSYTVQNLICHNCQAFSIAGKRLGFEDTRGTLFFHVARILKYHKPQIVFLENVKGLKSHDRGNTYRVIKQTLEDLGYRVFDKVLNARDFGVPQNRERIFIVGFLDHSIEFEFPEKIEKSVKLGDILEDEVDEKYTLSDELWAGHQRRKRQHELRGNGFGYRLFNRDSEYTSTISARYYKDGSEILIEQEGKNPRKLTPREAARLQGFSDDFKITVSNTQAYKEFGNSVAVPVIEAIATKIKEAIS